MAFVNLSSQNFQKYLRTVKMDLIFETFAKLLAKHLDLRIARFIITNIGIKIEFEYLSQNRSIALPLERYNLSRCSSLVVPYFITYLSIVRLLIDDRLLQFRVHSAAADLLSNRSDWIHDNYVVVDTHSED